jgi:acetyl-CoA carboxylase biotin carboxyl carrier protein
MPAPARRDDAVGLVARCDHRHHADEGSVSCPVYCLLGSIGERRLEDRVTDIEAHITGTVWKIECAVGDTIEEGDTVAILESMKMEMPVEAEDSGTVTEVRCQEGQAVNEGDTLIVLD